MFKKLKDKIAEEVKISPQRIQQLTQSVTERLQNNSSDENFFSIGNEGENPNSSGASLDGGFSNVHLNSYSSNGEPAKRKNSTSSMASDISFLNRYESPALAYHVQSDLDQSASEFEDNNSTTSSQIGHLSKEQVYSAYQKAQRQYHKYRGRFTDLQNHYKELERENSKIQSLLVSTQDKALRKIKELKEQCTLEQNAKAHLENALREDMNEKDILIKTLKDKIKLLQNSLQSDSPLIEINENPLANNDNIDKTVDVDVLTRDLKEARIEIENLNEKNQELKAAVIVYQSKEIEVKNKIYHLEEKLKVKTKELIEMTEREKANNLKIAETKMELHNVIQNKDLVIENYKSEIEILRSELNKVKDEKTNVKLENLQVQNSKLIEKIEILTEKCNRYESELIKIEQLKIELENCKVKNKELEILSKQFQKFDDVNEPSLVIEKNKMEEAMEEKTKIIENLNTELESLKNTLKHQNEISEKYKLLNEEMNEKTKIIDSLKTELTILQSNLKKLNEETERITVLKKEVNDKTELIEKLNCELVIANNDFNQKNKILKEEISKKTEIVENLKSELETLKYALNGKNKISEKNKILEAELNEKTEITENLNSEVETLKHALNEKNKILEKEINEKNKNIENLNFEVKKLKEALNENNKTSEKNEILEQEINEKIKTIEQLTSDLKSFEVFHELEVKKLRNETKASLISLEEKIQNKLTSEFLEKEIKLKNDFDEKIGKITTKERTNKELEIKVIEKEEEIKNLKEEINCIRENLLQLKDDYKELETNHLQLISVNTKTEEELLNLRKDLEMTEESLNDLSVLNYQNTILKFEQPNSKSKLQHQILNLARKIENLIGEKVNLMEKLNLKIEETLGKESEINLLQNDLRNYKEQFDTIIKENDDLKHFKHETNELQKKIVEKTEMVNKAEADVNVKKDEIMELKAEINKLVLENNESKNALNDAFQQIKDLKEDLKIKTSQNEGFLIKLKDLDDDNKRLIELQDVHAKISETNSALQREIKDSNEKIKQLQNKFSEIENENLKLKHLEDLLVFTEKEKTNLHEQNLNLENQIHGLLTKNQQLENSLQNSTKFDQEYQNVIKESEEVYKKYVKLNNEIEELNGRNEKLLADHESIYKEYENVLSENEELKIKRDEFNNEKTEWKTTKEEYEERIEELIRKINDKNEVFIEIEEYKQRVETLNKELEESQEENLRLEEQIKTIIDEKDLVELEKQYTTLETEFKSTKSKFEVMKQDKEHLEEQKKLLEKQLSEIDHHFSEISYENQLLKDEIQELKISPLNYESNDKKLDNLSILETEKNLIENDKQGVEKEVQYLQNKLVHYESLHLTNQSSIHFYEDELQKLKNKNDKLNRTLDETLVTLNHITELQSSTEMEYLKNVLYNYMLGKEGMVLARVIAAVCKFDKGQTEAVLQKEQQKQTLLGSLGIV